MENQLEERICGAADTAGHYSGPNIFKCVMDDLLQCESGIMFSEEGSFQQHIPMLPHPLMCSGYSKDHGHP